MPDDERHQQPGSEGPAHPRTKRFWRNERQANPAKSVDAHQDRQKRATLVNVHDAGHLLPLEKTQATADHIAGFLPQLDGK